MPYKITNISNTPISINSPNMTDDDLYLAPGQTGWLKYEPILGSLRGKVTVERVSDNEVGGVSTKEDIGLGLVENISPLEMPVSTATQNALDTQNTELIGLINNARSESSAQLEGYANYVDEMMTAPDFIYGPVGSALEGDFARVGGFVGLVENKGTPQERLRIGGGGFDIIKDPGVTFAKGDPLYWDIANRRLSNVGDYFVGIAEAASGASSVPVRLLARTSAVVADTRGIARSVSQGLDAITVLSSGGDGPNDMVSNLGEDRGDGICSWGAQCTIANNIIWAMPGTDARIGIHVEALAVYATTAIPYSNSIASITGNIVYGPFRRGIVDELVHSASITGNVVAGANWWGVEIATVNRVAVSGNSVIFDRSPTDNTGGGWSPQRAAIHMFGNSKGCSITGNAVYVPGAGHGIALQSSDASYASNIVISGNTIEGSANCTNGIHATYADKVSIIGNNVSNIGAGHGIYLGTLRSAIVANNDISGVTFANGRGIECTTPTKFLGIRGNHVSGAQVGIRVINSTAGASVVDNYVENCTSTPIDVYGSSGVLCVNNHMKGNANANVPSNITNGTNNNILKDNVVLA